MEGGNETKGNGREKTSGGVEGGGMLVLGEGGGRTERRNWPTRAGFLAFRGLNFYRFYERFILIITVCIRWGGGFPTRSQQKTGFMYYRFQALRVGATQFVEENEQTGGSEQAYVGVRERWICDGGSTSGRTEESKEMERTAGRVFGQDGSDGVGCGSWITVHPPSLKELLVHNECSFYRIKLLSYFFFFLRSVLCSQMIHKGWNEYYYIYHR